MMQPADVAPLPETLALRALDPGSKLLVVLGTAFHGSIGETTTQGAAEAPGSVRPLRQ